MTKRTIQGLAFGFTVACSWAIAVPALAGGDKGHKSDKAEAEIKMMDTNADGKLSPTEHSAGAQKMFATIDSNSDGKVTATEMDAARDAKMAAHKGDHDKGDKGDKGKWDDKHRTKMSSAEKIKVIDTDGDGVLTAAEHSTGAMQMFSKMDTDKDGQLSKNELAAGHHKMMTKPAK